MVAEKTIRKKKIAVLGVTGYTGMELMRLLLVHPGVEVVFASSERFKGQKLDTVHPHLSGAAELTCSKLRIDDIPEETDLVFCALPHGKSMEVVPALLGRNFRVVDLSADFRLKDASLYPQWYERLHSCPEFLAEAVYGMPELYRKEIAAARLVANPGCYPTGIILALAPFMAAALIGMDDIIIDAKSGVSGAGRSPRQPFHFPECNENFKAYRIATHQHTPEIEQELAFVHRNGKDTGKGASPDGCGAVQILFTPHLAPMSRGILSTIYVNLHGEHDEGELLDRYRSFYREEPFVKVMEPPLLPETSWVRGSNYCFLSLCQDARTGKLVLISAIDNLVKGASGQAVQNMNIMCGWPERTGLQNTALTP
ncbi:MAG: N-acetyl-gamma-glutamyl-phosphate reductase [Firmicutes bacterium]|nr:N-acetyl-gamma-glutamyl-phosphate reductase [Bacillota bacterium]